MEKKITLHEVVVKTSYLTQITKPEDKDLARPVGFGSGFIVEYEQEKYFVTADHTIHLDDYKGKEGRNGEEYVISIFNNYSDPNNFPSTALTPLGGFYYFDKFRVDKLDELPQPVDVCVCKMKGHNLLLPFLTDEVRFENVTINAGEEKFIFRIASFCEPDVEKAYFVFGKIKTKLRDGIRLEAKSTFKQFLQFVRTSGDFLLFNTPELIADYEEWDGLSGSPVISEDGECVGVLCDVLVDSTSIWVMPISKVKMIIEVIHLQEKISK